MTAANATKTATSHKRDSAARILSCLLLAGLLAAFGCTQHLPTYRWIDQQHALERVAQRASGIDSLSLSGRVRLVDPNGSAARLRFVMIATSQGAMRFRAWPGLAGASTVMDVTLNPQGLFVYTRKSDDREQAGMPALDASHAHKLQQALFNPLAGGQWQLEARTDRDKAVYRRKLDGGGSMSVHLDKATLTVRTMEFHDNRGSEVAVIHLSHYFLVEGVPFPAQIEAHSPDGTIALHVNEVELNADLPSTAFQPHPKAVRQGDEP